MFRDDDTEKFSAAVIMKLVHLGWIVFFGEFELSRSSGKKIEKNDHSHLACSM